MSEATRTPPRPGPAGPAKHDAGPDRAWDPYEPSARCPWDLARAAHLYRRAGFGATWDELRQALKAGPQRAVDRLLDPEGEVASFSRTCDDYEKAAASAGALRAWWLRRIIQTPHPLLEKMTLFWHDFFAVGTARVAALRCWGGTSSFFGQGPWVVSPRCWPGSPATRRPCCRWGPRRTARPDPMSISPASCFIGTPSVRATARGGTSARRPGP